MENKIDFVILWVDGNDQKWQKEKAKYSLDSNRNDVNGEVRYRDWDNLKYWFRGVEKYAPWVNKIYFITWGHLPAWLNINNPKLKIINHKDYMPKEYLPVFSSNPIELNIHRVKDLSEHFVLFNDDVFLINDVKKEDFFKNGIPVDNYNEVNWDSSREDPVFSSIVKNNYKVLNSHYEKRKVLFSHFFKFFNPKYGLKRNLQTIKTSITKPTFVGINNNHISQPFLKSYFEKVWQQEYDVLNETSLHKFRSDTDVSQWLIRYFQLMDGKFIPRDFNLGKFFIVGDDNRELVNTIKQQKYKIVCINDSNKNINFEKCKAEINKAFDTMLPNKSSFEK